MSTFNAIHHRLKRADPAHLVRELTIAAWHLWSHLCLSDVVFQESLGETSFAAVRLSPSVDHSRSDSDNISDIREIVICMSDVFGLTVKKLIRANVDGGDIRELLRTRILQLLDLEPQVLLLGECFTVLAERQHMIKQLGSVSGIWEVVLDFTEPDDASLVMTHLVRLGFGSRIAPAANGVSETLVLL